MTRNTFGELSDDLTLLGSAKLIYYLLMYLTTLKRNEKCLSEAIGSNIFKRNIFMLIYICKIFHQICTEEHNHRSFSLYSDSLWCSIIYILKRLAKLERR